MSPALLLLAAFLAGVLIVAGGYSILSDLFLRDRERLSKRVDQEFRQRQRERARTSMLLKNYSDLNEDVLQEFEGGTTSWRSWLEAMIEQSDLDLTPRRLLTIMAAVGLMVSLLVSLIFFNAVIGLGVGLVAGVVPLWYVSHKRAARLLKMNNQLPDAFDLMARVIRAGQTISQALLAVADEFPMPIAAEFAYCYEQQNLGLSPELARMGDPPAAPDCWKSRSSCWRCWSSSRLAATLRNCSTSWRRSFASGPSCVEKSAP